MHGIRFTVWMVFILFAMGIVIGLGLLEFAFFNPYYKNTQINAVSLVATRISDYLISNSYTSGDSLQKALETTVNSNACTLVLNNKGQQLYYGDGIGSSCIFNGTITIDGVSFQPHANDGGQYLVDLLSKSDGELSVVLTNTDTSQETILYGKSISKEFANYYIFVNSPVEPNDSLIQFFINSFSVYTVIIIALSFVVAFILSRRLSKPFVMMTKSAEELGKGNYSVAFNGGYFNESKELAETLNYATDKLSKVDELRKDLIANVSHDIKTPLTMISAYAEMIKDISGDNPSKRNEHLDVILKESAFLNRLVTDMSELSQMQSGTYVLSLSEFDMVEVVRDMIELCQMLLDKNGLTVELINDNKVMVEADEIKLGQVVYNFLTNAIKHSHPNSKIIIKVQNKLNSIYVSVQDFGDGIDKEKQDYVWDRYYKVDKSFKRNSLQSTGLGLAIVKAILDCHHAKYGVISKKGKGSTFYFECAKKQNGLSIE